VLKRRHKEREMKNGHERKDKRKMKYRRQERMKET
jgi:hypothetical protein